MCDEGTNWNEWNHSLMVVDYEASELGNRFVSSISHILIGSRLLFVEPSQPWIPLPEFSGHAPASDYAYQSISTLELLLPRDKGYPKEGQHQMVAGDQHLD